jgi:dihydroflavonol-4-reductase
MKIFITGATGFIGSYLAERLAGTAHEMICLVRDADKAQNLKTLGATLVTGDVTDKRSILTGMADCDWVIHLANIYSFWERRESIFKEVNVEGTRNVLECALELGIPKVLHVSTMAAYGKPAELPFTEETPAGPEQFSAYARSKYEGDLIAWDLYKEKGLPLVVLYPGPVLGKGDTQFTGQLIKRLVQGRQPALAFPNTITTYVHARDVAEAIVRAAEKEDNIGEKYLLGNERLTSQEFFIMICRIAGVSIPNFAPDPYIFLGARLMTGLANLIKRPPFWGLTVDGMRSSMEGIEADGTKAERELGITYISVRTALEEMIESIQPDAA